MRTLTPLFVPPTLGVPALVLLCTAFGGFAVVGMVLTVIDLREHRLPNRIVLPSLGAALVLFAGVWLAGGEAADFVRALAAMLVLGGAFLVLRFIDPRALGGGDVKLAALVGTYLGWAGWNAVLIGVLAAFILAAAYALVLMALRRANGATKIAFGPWMIAGAWIGICSAVVAGY